MKNKCVYIAVAIVVIVATICIATSNDRSCNAESCAKQSTAAAQETKPEMDKIKDNLKSGAILVDVRTAEEYTAAHAQGAINLSYDQIVSGTYPTKDKNTVIYLYCGSGKRADVALDALKKAGYANAKSLVSLSNWQSMGGAVVKYVAN